MKKSLMRIVWALVLSLFMVIETVPNSLFAEGEQPTATVSISSIQYSESGNDGTWNDLNNGVSIKNGTHLRISGTFDVLNTASSDNESIELTVDLAAENIKVDNYPRQKIKSNWTSEFEITDNVLHIYLSAEDRNKSDIQGNFNISGVVDLNTDTVKDGDNVTIKLGDKTVEVNYDQNITESGLYTNKTQDGSVYKGEDGNFYQNYKIDIGAYNGNVTINRFNDIAGNGLSYSGKVKVQYPDGNSAYYDSFDSIPEAELAKDQHIYITYVTKLNVNSVTDLFDDSKVSVTNGYKNSFDVTYTTNRNNQKTDGKNDVGVTVNKPSVSKNGSYDAETGHITWTITINIGSYKDVTEDNLSLLVKQITDTMDPSLELEKGQPDPAIPSNYQENPAGSGIYTLTYETKLKDGTNITGGKKVKNDITVTFPDGDKHAEGEVTVTGDTLINKSFTGFDSETGVFTWNVNVKFVEGMTSVTLTDSPDSQQQHGNNFVIKMGDVVLYDNGETADFNTVFDSCTAYYDISLNFKQDFVNTHVNQSVNFTVQTKVSDKNSIKNKTEYSNEAKLNYNLNDQKLEQKSQSEYTYSTIVDKYGYAQNDDKGTVKYTLKVGLSDYAGLKVGDVLTIHDELDAGYVIDPSSIKATYNNYRWLTTNDNPSVSYSEETHDFTYAVDDEFINSVNNKNDGQTYGLAIEYNAYPSDISSLYNNSGKYDGTGTAEVKNSIQAKINDDFVGSALSDTNVSLKKILDKTGIWKVNGTNMNHANWTLSINPMGATLNGGNSLKAVDQLSSGLIYDLTSIKVKNKSTGNELDKTQYSYTYSDSDNSLVFTLPDSTPLEITYQTLFNVSSGTNLDETNTNNSLMLYGSNDNQLSDVKYHLNGEYVPSMDITGLSADLTITKYDADDIQEFLDNAKFSVYWAEYDKKNDTMNVSDKPFTSNKVSEFETDSNGKAYVNGLRLDVIYQVKETAAPEGYSTAEPRYVIFKGKDFDKISIPDSLSKYKISVFEVKQGNVNIADKKNEIVTPKGTLTITKTIEGYTPTEDDLNRIKVTVKDADNKTVYSGTLKDMQNEDGTLSKTLTDLELGKYTVTETDADIDGYERTTTYNVNETETNKVEVEENTPANVEIHNSYRHKEGVLEFTKTFVGEVPEGVTDKIQFKVTKEDGTEVGTYPLSEMEVDANGVYHKKIGGLTPGKYTVTEINEEAEGYTLKTTYKVGEKETKEAEVKDGKTVTVNITNTYTEKPGKLVITKTVNGNVTEEALKNVKFTVTGPEEYSKEFTLAAMKQEDGSYRKELNNLKAGEYTVSEENADVEHYVRTTTYTVGGNESEGSVTVIRDTETDLNITNTYTFVPEKTSYSVWKVWDDSDNVNGTRPENLAVQLLRNGQKFGETVILNQDNEWTYTWNDLDKTDEYMREYSYAVEEEFVENYSEKSVSDENGTVLTNTYIDRSKPVCVSKTDKDGKIIAGAKLSVLDSVKNVIVSWTTVEDEDKQISLNPGNYILHEDEAPVGYELAEDIPFSVDENGTVLVNGKETDKVTMVDKSKSYTVSVGKVDSLSGKKISGAKLKLTDSDGNVVDEWVSDKNNVHEINLGAGTYVLSETEAPEDYKIADNIEFTVNQYGEITVDGKQVDQILMKDVRKDKIIDTGDHSHIALYGCVSLAMLGIAVMAFITRIKMN